MRVRLIDPLELLTLPGIGIGIGVGTGTGQSCCEVSGVRPAAGGVAQRKRSQAGEELSPITHRDGASLKEYQIDMVPTLGDHRTGPGHRALRNAPQAC
jgi:hypothetical protein